MSNYVRPDTYFEKVNTGEQPIELLGTKIGRAHV